MSETLSKVRLIEPKHRWGRFQPVARRGHGGTAWSTQTSLMQPQDGASDLRDAASRITDIGTRLQVAAFGGVALSEPDDARITGGTRSLVRRMLGLNIAPRLAAPSAVAKARPVKKIVRATNQVQVA